jgi:hypothetical protein
MSAGVVALLHGDGLTRELAAGFEEEGVPLTVEARWGEAFALAREAARRSPLGLGVGADSDGLVLVLAAAPGSPYLSARAAEARGFGHAAARLAAGRPLARRGHETWGGVAP